MFGVINEGEQNTEVFGVHVESSFLGDGSSSYYCYCCSSWKGKVKNMIFNLKGNEINYSYVHICA